MIGRNSEGIGVELDLLLELSLTQLREHWEHGAAEALLLNVGLGLLSGDAGAEAGFLTRF